MKFRLLVFLLIHFTMCYSQSLDFSNPAELHGVIIDSKTKLPVHGASVMIDRVKLAVTDPYGTFSIKVNRPDRLLIVQHVNYEWFEMEIPHGEKTQLDLALEDKVYTLNGINLSDAFPLEYNFANANKDNLPTKTGDRGGVENSLGWMNFIFELKSSILLDPNYVNRPIDARVLFTISKEGHVTNISFDPSSIINRSVEPNREIIVNAIKHTGSWSPAFENGIPSDTRYKLILMSYEKNSVYSIVEKNAEPVEGFENFKISLRKRILEKYPERGQLFVEVVISSEGKLENALLYHVYDDEMMNYLIDLVMTYTDWNPAVLHGKNVAQRIVFEVFTD